MSKQIFILLASFLVLAVFIQAKWTPEPLPISTTSDNPTELGRVSWLRDYDKAKKQSKLQQKPIFLLFQEVPGCMTCKNYGTTVLSHPLVVEAIESAFVPVAVFNNVGGADRSILKSFQEPAWNNPVVRLVDDQNKDLVPRLSGDYTLSGLVSQMIAALEKARQPVPTYFALLNEELQTKKKGTKQATFAMYCFWTGESRLGSVEGVVKTESGFMNGKEVVRLEYDPKQVSFVELTEKAAKFRCASAVYTNSENERAEAAKVVGESKVGQEARFRKDAQPKYYLGNTNWKYLPMTELQKMRVNTALSQNQSPKEFMSKRQLELYQYIDKHPYKGWRNVINSDKLFTDWWNAVDLVKKKS